MIATNASSRDHEGAVFASRSNLNRSLTVAALLSHAWRQRRVAGKPARLSGWKARRTVESLFLKCAHGARIFKRPNLQFSFCNFQFAIRFESE
jgi:hypothetical protein